MSLPTTDLAAPTRRQLRQRLATHIRRRSFRIGPCLHLRFEDETTVRSALREQLALVDRKAPEDPALAQSLQDLAGLIPDGRHWCARLRIEPTVPALPVAKTAVLRDAAQLLYVQVGAHQRLCPLISRDPCPPRPAEADSWVLRFMLTETMRAHVHQGALVQFGCSHEHYAYRRRCPPVTLDALRTQLHPPQSPAGEDAAGSPAETPDPR